MKYISTSIYKCKNQRNKAEDIHDVTVRHELKLFSLRPEIVRLSSQVRNPEESFVLFNSIKHMELLKPSSLVSLYVYPSVCPPFQHRVGVDTFPFISFSPCISFFPVLSDLSCSMELLNHSGFILFGFTT